MRRTIQQRTNSRHHWRVSLLGLSLVALTACGSGMASQPTAASGATTVPGATAVFGQRVTPEIRTGIGATPTLSTVTPSAATGFTVIEMATGLDMPWELAFAPAGRIFITERPGRLRVIENGTLRAEPVAIVPDVTEQGEGGLLGLVLDPEYATNGTLYLYHTYRADGLRNRVISYRVQDTAAARGLSDPRVIIDNIPAGSTHNGGRIAFGPDGTLYVTTGDAGNSVSAQDRNSLGVRSCGSTPMARCRATIRSPAPGSILMGIAIRKGSPGNRGRISSTRPSMDRARTMR